MLLGTHFDPIHMQTGLSFLREDRGNSVQRFSHLAYTPLPQLLQTSTSALWLQVLMSFPFQMNVFTP